MGCSRNQLTPRKGIEIIGQRVVELYSYRRNQLTPRKGIKTYLTARRASSEHHPDQQIHCHPEKKSDRDSTIAPASPKLQTNFNPISPRLRTA
jgi:hypothetical protein